MKITFEGGPKTISDAIGSPWETAQRRTAAGLLNTNVIRKIDREIIYQPCGEELLVITNPATLSAANTYATARRAAGFLTRVFQTGSAAVGTTATSIQAFIRSHVNHPFCIRPSYVTIIGDDEFVPTFTTGPGGIPSDNPYSTKNDTDELPDVAVGRILGNTLAQIDAQLAKIIHYETSPPTGPMLNKAIVAAQFQDTDDVGEVNDGQEDRTFIQFAETARNGLAARGVAVDRIYEDNPTTNPTKFNDGTAMPAALQKPTFPWDGDGADVSAAWNQGRFMVIHRDHGWSDGWGDPFFTTTEVDALTNNNDNLPVVLSINCASARYDDDETSFTQNALVKPTGGAVGVFGDTRNSPSWHNSQLALGFLDAMLPTVLAGEGPASKQRMGDALTHGKLRLVGLAPPSGPGIAGGDGNTRAELYLWHYFGDPTMQLWGGGSAPIVLNPAVFKAVYKELPTAEARRPAAVLRRAHAPCGPGRAADQPAAQRRGHRQGARRRRVGRHRGDVQRRRPEAGRAVDRARGRRGRPAAGAGRRRAGQADGADAELPAERDGQLADAVGPGHGDRHAARRAGGREGHGDLPGARTERRAQRQHVRPRGHDRRRTARGARPRPPSGPTSATWSVSSSYAGGDGYAGSSAGPCTFTVQLPPS